MNVVLAKGAKVPKVGDALLIAPSPRTPKGVLGVVTTVAGAAGGQTRVTTKPGTIEDAYTSFEAHINGTLGELSEHASQASELAHTAVNLDPFSDASFDCDNPSVKDSITHKIDLSDLQVDAEVEIPSWKNGFSGPGVLFTIGGQPKLGLGVKFSGDETCTAKTLADIPIPEAPGLELEIGPNFTLHASGAVGVELEWTPRIFYGFSRFRSEPDNNWESFHNGGRTNFTGDANLTLGLALEAGLSLDGRVGIRGSLGPQIKGSVSAQSSPPRSCLSVDADFAANLSAFANDFFNDYTFTIGSATFGNLQLYHECTSTGSGGGTGGSSNGSGGSTAPGGGTTPPNPEGASVAASTLDVGMTNACAVVEHGHVDCWGSNQYGQLGDETNIGPEKCLTPEEDVEVSCSKLPVRVANITDAASVGVGFNGSCALLASGSVDCWGQGLLAGENGSSNWREYFTPTPVAGISDATELSVGTYSACAVLKSGSVDCWGGGTQAEPVSGVSDATDVSVGTASGLGEESICVVLADGAVKCWGANSYGMLGIGTNNGPETCPWTSMTYPCSTAPVDVSGINDAASVSVGVDSVCALLENGAVRCWGLNEYGELGSGTAEGPETCTLTYEYETQTCSTVPFAVSGINDATDVSVGDGLACAVLGDGNADCWGWNAYLQLGDGVSDTDPFLGPETCTGFKIACSTVPIPVSGITDAASVSAGLDGFSACAVLTDGAADCWGWNGDLGLLGNGGSSEEDYDVPIPVSGLGEGTATSSLVIGKDHRLRAFSKDLPAAQHRAARSPIDIAYH